MPRLGSLLLLLIPFTAAAQHEYAGVLGTIDRFFIAMTARDSAAMAATLVPGGTLQVVSPDGQAEVRTMTFADYMSKLRNGSSKLEEVYWDPLVHIDGPLATVTTPYDFHVDGVLSHCGVDVFTLVRDGGHWRIANVAYTRITEGCPPRPGEPRKKR